MSPIGYAGYHSSFTEEIPMPRPLYYSPAIERFLVSVLYHEARHRKIPMTQLANEILKNGLADSTGWQLATEPLNGSKENRQGK